LNPAHRRRISPRKGGKDHSMARTNPFQFLQQTRSEIAKVVWPTRREVAVTTAMVFVMATLTAVFFFLVDFTIRTGLQAVLNYFG
jgi:preprotein translocase subunit SecE